MITRPVLRIPYLAILFVLFGCSTAPYTGRSQFIIMSESSEMKLGLEASQEILAEARRETDTPRARRVATIGQDIAAVAERQNFDWQFHTIVANDINAFCLPGGRVFVYTGILEMIGDNDAELAAIMGHEIAHALARHGAERSSQTAATSLVTATAGAVVSVYTNSSAAGELAQSGGTMLGQLGFLLPYSRLQESEADRIGVILAAKAGYDPQGAISLWEKMAAQNEGKEPLRILSTHPLNRERQAALRKIMPEALGYYHPGS